MYPTFLFKEGSFAYFMRRILVSPFLLVLMFASTGCLGGSPSQATRVSSRVKANSDSKAFSLHTSSRVDTALALTQETSGTASIAYATEAQVLNAIESANAAVVHAATAETRASDALAKALAAESRIQEAYNKAVASGTTADIALAAAELAKAAATSAEAKANAGETRANTAASQTALIEAQARQAFDTAVAAGNEAALAKAAAALADSKGAAASAAAAAADARAAAADARAAAADVKASTAAQNAQQALDAAISASTSAGAAATRAQQAADAVATVSSQVQEALSIANAAAAKAEQAVSQAATLNVKQFGAKGDGTTDDAPALQLAIDEAAQKHRPLYFPAGTYRIKRGLELRSNLHMSGEGTILLDETAAVASLSVGGMRMLNNSAGTALTNVFVEGLVFDGNLPLWIGAVTSANRGKAPGGIRFANISNLRLSNIKCRNMMENGISASSIKRLIIEGCEVSDFYGAGVIMSACDYVLVEGNLIRDGHETFSMYGRSASNGIFMYDLGSFVQITNNTIIDQTDVGIELGAQVNGGAVNVSVSNNTIKSQSESKRVFSSLAAALTPASTSLSVNDGAAFPASGSIKIENEIIDYTSKTGNTLSGLTRGSYYTQAVAHSTGARVSMSVFPSGIFLIGSANATVSGNVVSGCLGDGIRADKGARDITITGNNIQDAYRGIRLSNERGPSSALWRVMVANNMIDARDHGIYVVGSNSTSAQNHRDISINGNVLKKTANLQGSSGIKLEGTPGQPVLGLSIDSNQISNFGYAIIGSNLRDFSIRENQVREVYRPIANWPPVTGTGVIHVDSAVQGTIRSNDLYNSRSGAGGIKVFNVRDVLVTDNYQVDRSPPATTLSSAMNAVDAYATITVADATMLPPPAARGTFIMIGSEILEVTARNGNVLSIRDGGRGFLGSQKAAHAAGDSIRLCSPSMFIDADISSMSRNNVASGSLSRPIDNSDVGGIASHAP